jgi:hypothetical protein
MRPANGYEQPLPNLSFGSPSFRTLGKLKKPVKCGQNLAFSQLRLFDQDPLKDIGGEFKNRARTIHREAKNDDQFHNSPPMSHASSTHTAHETRSHDAFRVYQASFRGISIVQEPLYGHHLAVRD